MTVREFPTAARAAVGNLPILAALPLLLVGIALGVGFTAAVKEQSILTGTRVVMCGETPMCPPDTDRVVLGMWTDGTLRLSQYTSDGWVDRDRSRVFEGGYVTSWREVPE